MSQFDSARSLQWRHGGRDSVSNHQRHDCLLNSDADQRKHKSCAQLAFMWGIHRWPGNSPHKWPLTRKMFPFEDIIMIGRQPSGLLLLTGSFSYSDNALYTRFTNRKLILSYFYPGFHVRAYIWPWGVGVVGGGGGGGGGGVGCWGVGVGGGGGGVGGVVTVTPLVQEWCTKMRIRWFRHTWVRNVKWNFAVPLKQWVVEDLLQLLGTKHVML